VTAQQNIEFTKISQELFGKATAELAAGHSPKTRTPRRRVWEDAKGGVSRTLMRGVRAIAGGLRLRNVSIFFFVLPIASGADPRREGADMAAESPIS
jgi:hypothetical protein